MNSYRTDARRSVAKATGATGGAATQFVLLTFALSWPLWIGTWLIAGHPDSIEAPTMMVAIYLGSFAPGAAAAILSLRAGRGELKAWARNFMRFRCGWRTFAVALLPLPLVFLALTALLGYTPRLGGQALPAAAFYLTLFPVSIFNAVATAVLGAGPLGEEGGWRGYLLPRLLERMGEARASLLIGVIWSCWHLPVMAMFADWRGGTSLTFYFPCYTIGLVALAYLFTVVWRLGKGSLIPCIWLHGLVNAIGGIAFDRGLWSSRWSLEASTAHSTLAFWIAAGGLWFLFARRADSPTYPEPSAAGAP